MEIQWPLVLFSLIAGTGGSLFAFVALSELLGGKEKTRFAATVTSLVLIVAGGCLSMLHLASPQNAFAALTNMLLVLGHLHRVDASRADIRCGPCLCDCCQAPA